MRRFSVKMRFERQLFTIFSVLTRQNSHAKSEFLTISTKGCGKLRAFPHQPSGHVHFWQRSIVFYFFDPEQEFYFIHPFATPFFSNTLNVLYPFIRRHADKGKHTYRYPWLLAKKKNKIEKCQGQILRLHGERISAQRIYSLDVYFTFCHSLHLQYRFKLFFAFSWHLRGQISVV